MFLCDYCGEAYPARRLGRAMVQPRGLTLFACEACYRVLQRGYFANRMCAASHPVTAR
jgi:hypothetical protein